MVGAAPVCPPERPRSGVSICKEHVPHPQRRHLHASKCLCIAHDAHLLTMDAPLQGDTGGHTGTAPTNLHQTPLPAIISCFCPSANRLPPTIPRVCSSANSSPAIISCFCPSAEPLPATLGHGATREMVGAAPVCPPERPRSGVSICKEHVLHPQRRRLHPQKCLCIAHDARLLTMDAPLQGDTGGHTGTAPTNLHQTLLPRNYLVCLFIGSPSPATNLSCVFVHRRTISLAAVNAVGARVLRTLRCNLCLLWQWLRGCLGQQSFRRPSHLRGRCR